MSVLPFLAVAIVGAVISTLLRDIRRLGTLAGLGAVVVALAAACFINPDTPLSIGGGALAGSDHLRVVLVLCLASGLLVLIVARLATWQPSAPGALLGGAAGIGLALGLAGTPPALIGAAAATVAASALALGSPAAPSRIRALARELRGATTSVVVGLIAAGIGSRARRAGRGRARAPRDGARPGASIRGDPVARPRLATGRRDAVQRAADPRRVAAGSLGHRDPRLGAGCAGS